MGDFFIRFGSMKIDEIYLLENKNPTTIHLIRDRLFYQAYERSAFYFVKYFREYKVHSKFFKKIDTEMVYLGFPDRTLAALEDETEKLGYVWHTIDENRIDIEGIPLTKDFELWKNNVIAKNEIAMTQAPGEIGHCFCSTDIPQGNYLLANREAYDLCLYVCQRSGNFFRNFRFGLGENLRAEAVRLTEHLHLVTMKIVKLDAFLVLSILGSMRIKVRLLSDLGQLNIKQWFYFNGKVEKIKELLRLESSSLKSGEIEPHRVQQPTQNQASSTLI